MTRVLHLITDLDTGGAELMLLRLLQSLRNEEFENTVVCLVPIGEVGEMIRELGISVYSLRMRPGWPSISGIIRLIRIMRRFSPDIIHAWLYHANLLSAIIFRLSGGKKLVWNILSAAGVSSKMTGVPRWLLRLCAFFSNQAHALAVNSVAGKDFHIELGYRPKKWYIIPNGVDTNIFQPDNNAHRKLQKALDLPQDAIIIGLIARYDPMKDHENFIEAAAEICKKTSDIHFVLVGQGVDQTNQHLTNLVDKHRHSDRIHLLGFRQDIAELTAGLDIATSSSYSEGLPTTIIEAMACCVPCVVTNVGDSALLVGELGSIVAPEDPKALAHGWEQLIALGKEGREKLGIASREKVLDGFGLDRMAQAYSSLYRDLFHL